MSRKNIFVVGMDEGNLAELRAVPDASKYAFHGVLTTEEGARASVHWATVGDDAPTGGFFDVNGPVPW